MNQKQKQTLIIIAFLVILLLIITIFLNNLPEEEIITEEQQVEIINQKIENKEIDKLSDMNEEDRMRQYLAKFIEHIEMAEFEEAYELLNIDFKNNYFKTYAEFESYAKTKFPKDISVKYNNFERSGEMYIFWITLSNPLTSTKDGGVEMNFVIKENGLNDFEMSFSVI